MSDKGQKVAIIIGASQRTGASLVTAYRRQGWSVVATAREMEPAQDPGVLTVDGGLADPATADQIISGALARFGRIDTLINNADVYISKRAIHGAVIPAAPQNWQIWPVGRPVNQLVTRHRVGVMRGLQLADHRSFVTVRYGCYAGDREGAGPRTRCPDTAMAGHHAGPAGGMIPGRRPDAAAQASAGRDLALAGADPGGVPVL